MGKFKAKIHVLHKLHGKIFATWNRLHVFIHITILFVVQMPTNIDVKRNHHVVQGLSLCRHDCLCSKLINGYIG